MGVNMASYVGYHMMGVAGSIVATLGLVAPVHHRHFDCGAVLEAVPGEPVCEGGDVRTAGGLCGPCGRGGTVGSRGHSAADSRPQVSPIHVGDMTLFSLQVPQTVAGLAGLFRWKEIVLAVILIFLTNWKPLRKLHPIVFLAICAVLGVIFHLAGL